MSDLLLLCFFNIMISDLTTGLINTVTHVYNKLIVIYAYWRLRLAARRTHLEQKCKCYSPT